MMRKFKERVSERIFHALFTHRERGLTINDLVRYAYDGEQDGGPLWDRQSVHGLILILNRRHLIPLGAKIVCEGKNTSARHRLVML